MSTTRRITIALLILSIVVVPAAAASAQSYDTPDGSAIVSPTSLSAGGQFSATGSGFAPSSSVDVFFGTTMVGTTTASTSGSATGTFTVPQTATSGTHRIDMVGVNPTGTARTVSTTVTIAGISTSNPQPTTLAFTGARVLTTLVVAGLLLAAGLMLTGLSKRRTGLT